MSAAAKARVRPDKNLSSKCSSAERNVRKVQTMQVVQGSRIYSKDKIDVNLRDKEDVSTSHRQTIASTPLINIEDHKTYKVDQESE